MLNEAMLVALVVVYTYYGVRGIHRMLSIRRLREKADGNGNGNGNGTGISGRPDRMAARGGDLQPAGLRFCMQRFLLPAPAPAREPQFHREPPLCAVCMPAQPTPYYTCAVAFHRVAVRGTFCYSIPPCTFRAHARLTWQASDAQANLRSGLT